MASDPFAPGAAHTATVESIAAGGAGVVRIGRRVVFVPRTVPGDVIRLRISIDKGKYLRGDLEEVCQAASRRREPPCPHWAECGGCPLQHMEPEGQLQAKKSIFLDALARIGKLSPPADPDTLNDPTPEFGYRMRVRFQIWGEGIGFFAPGTRRLVPLRTCLLVEPSIAGALPEIRRLLREQPVARGVEAVEVTALGSGPEEAVGLLVHPLGSRDGGSVRSPRPSRSLRRAWESFASRMGWPLSFTGDRRPGEPPAWTSRYELETTGGDGESSLLLSMQASPESFVQANRPGNRALVRAVGEIGLPPSMERALDLYCGVGNFTLPLALRAGRVIGVENNPFSLRDAEENARRAGLGNIRFLRGHAERIEADAALEALGGAPPDLVLLDPPRRGALEAIPLVLALAPEEIVYVSCHPATFARDARALREGGYRIRSAFLAPMFPQTAHVESVTSWTAERSAA